MRLTPSARAWLANALDAAPDAIHLEKMTGATSSSVYAVRATSGADAVLRLFDNSAWNIDEPDLAAHEAAALEEAGRTATPAPSLIAWSAIDVGFGCPCLLMTRVQGSVALTPSDPDAWTERLAFALAAIHSHPAEDLCWSYFPWFDPSTAVVPAWSPKPTTWQSAIEIARRPAPETPTVFIHRDFHPVNVLWQDGQVSGIVDWVNACRGPASADIAHCRSNLAFMYGPAVADQFLGAYELASPGFRHDPYWDIVSILDWSLPRPTPYRPWAEFGLPGITETLMEARAEAFLARLLPV